MPDETGSIPPLELANVTIGVLTALEEEYAACLDVFDPDGSGKEVCCRATSGNMVCWLCVVPALHGGHHVVAIRLLPDMGNNAAAIAANLLLQHCDGIRHLIMCGVAGAVPHPQKAECHVRLGDIVVSTEGVIQYDRGKQRDPRTQPLATKESKLRGSLVSIILCGIKAIVLRKEPNQHSVDPLAGFEARYPQRPPCPVLRDAVKRIHATEMKLGDTQRRPWELTISKRLESSDDRKKWGRPHESSDSLIDSADGVGPPIPHPCDALRRSGHPRVFRGRIGTGNIVQADPRRRDALRERDGILAIDMEGSGIADAGWVASVGYLDIRGTCDYCNSTKNNDWHNYAALIAAAYTRTVIEYLHPCPTPSGSPGYGLPIQDPACLIGDDTWATMPRSVPDLASEPTTHEVGTLANGTSSTARNVDLGRPGISASTNDVQGMRRGAIIRDLVPQLRELMEDYCWRDIPVVAAELEEHLRLFPRQGHTVREGWLLLARVEATRLFSEKKAGREVDASRLRALRQEAEHVVD